MSLVSKKILNRFFNNCEITDISNYGNGHINNTFLVSTNSGKFILQQVNKNVFNIDKLVWNYNYLIEAALEQKASGKLFPDFITDSSGQFHFIDTDGTAWRLNRFVEGSSSYSIPPDTSITEKAGRAMGKFQLFLTKLNADIFKDTIPDFHSPLRRLGEFEKALKITDETLQKAAIPEIEIAVNNRNIALKMSDLLNNNNLPIRITHNDTKLDNILFDHKKNSVYVIDLDTVMKGSILFDFGDMVRSITSVAKEDEKDLKKVTFKLDHFEALSKGYFNEIKSIITPIEKDNILTGALSIIYLQGLRFLTDYLLSNIYYKTDYPTHNLIRSRTQFKLLEEILTNKEKAESIIQDAFV
jgi:Ser/Thr protein kinase RdoA (MazF antagonist)